MANYVHPPLDIADGVTTVAASFAAPELLPFIGPFFKITKGIVSIATTGEDQTSNILRGIQQSVQKLAAQSTNLSQGLGLLILSNEALDRINSNVIAYADNIQSIDDDLKKQITNPITGLGHDLRSLQNTISKGSKLVPSQQSWIEYIVEHCLVNSVLDTDDTWGIETSFVSIFSYSCSSMTSFILYLDLL